MDHFLMVSRNFPTNLLTIFGVGAFRLVSPNMKDEKSTFPMCGADPQPIDTEPNTTVELGLLPSPSAVQDRRRSAHAKEVEKLLAMRLLTEKQVSVITAIPTGTLRRWRSVGEGPPYIKMGNGPKARVKYDAVAILAYVEAGRRFPSVRATLERSHGHQ